MSESNAQMNSQEQTYDIAIVGAGIVGLSLALALSTCKVSSGLRIALIDAQGEPESLSRLSEIKASNSFDARVSALTAASQTLLSELGVWQEIAGLSACAYNEMFVWDADGTGSIEFSAADIHAPNLGHIVENSLIVAALNKALLTKSNVTFYRSQKVKNLETSSATQIQLESGVCLKCQLVVGADGSNSFIRRQAGFDTREWDYLQQAIVTTVKTEKSHEFRTAQCFMNTGPLAFLPLLNTESGQRHEQFYSSIVWSCVPERADELMALSDESFSEALAKAFEYKLGKIEEVQPRFCFPLKQCHAKDYVSAGVALIGDAAHTIHPLAGQGVNLGLLDVAALSAVISAACENGEDYASLQVLSRYQRKRKGGNLTMMLLMEGFKRLFASDTLSLRWLRNIGLHNVDSLPSIKNKVMSKAMGLD